MRGWTECTTCVAGDDLCYVSGWLAGWLVGWRYMLERERRECLDQQSVMCRCERDKVGHLVSVYRNLLRICIKII